MGEVSFHGLSLMLDMGSVSSTPQTSAGTSVPNFPDPTRDKCMIDTGFARMAPYPRVT